MNADKYQLAYKGCPPDHCCCDSTLRILPNGDYAIFFLTGGPVEPHPDNYIGLIRSNDPENVWNKDIEVVFRNPGGACLLSEAIVQDGRITLFIHTHQGRFDKWENWIITSDDNAKTWSEPESIIQMPRRAYFRTMIKTSWGEWLLPYQRYEEIEWDKPVGDDGSMQNPFNGVLISDDKGKNWQVSESTTGANGWAENMVVELAGEKLVMLVRSDGSGCLMKSTSDDKGRSWTPFENTDIPNPGTKFKLFKLSDGRIVLLHNPNSATNHPNSRQQCAVHRNPLAVWISDDEMKTWSYKRILTDFPGMLAYPDGVLSEDEQTIHFAFDYNRHDVIYWAAAIPEK
jgi:predicted neuraminidase